MEARPQPDPVAAPHLATVVFRRSLWTKAAMALVKLVVGVWSGSKALTADGFNSLADVATNGGAWIGFHMAQSPADDDHHYGHGGFEALTALALGVLVLGGAVALLWDAVVHPVPELGGRDVYFVVGAAALSIAANLWLARITEAAGRVLQSPTLMALARDNRSDVLSSGLVVVGAGANAAGASWAEPVAAGLIAAMIAAMGLRSAREGLDILLDRVSDKGLRDRIAEAARPVAGVRAVHNVRVHPLGREQRVDLDVAVDPHSTVAQAHLVARRVEAAIVAVEPSVLAVHVALLPDGIHPEQAPGSPAEPQGRTPAP